MNGNRTKINSLKNQAGPMGSGFFVLKIIGTIMLIFATGLIAFPFATSLTTTLFANQPCMLWGFAIVLILMSMSFIWIGDKQGSRR